MRYFLIKSVNYRNTRQDIVILGTVILRYNASFKSNFNPITDHQSIEMMCIGRPEVIIFLKQKQQAFAEFHLIPKCR